MWLSIGTGNCPEPNRYEACYVFNWVILPKHHKPALKRPMTVQGLILGLTKFYRQETAWENCSALRRVYRPVLSVDVAQEDNGEKCTSQNSRCCCSKHHASQDINWKRKGQSLSNVPLVKEENLSQSTQQSNPQGQWARAGSYPHTLAAREAGT